MRARGQEQVEVELVEEPGSGQDAPDVDPGPDWRDLVRRVPRRAWVVVAGLVVVALALPPVVEWRAERAQAARLVGVDGLAASLAEPLVEQWRVGAGSPVGIVGDVLVMGTGPDQGAVGVGVEDGVVRWEREGGSDAVGWCWFVPVDRVDAPGRSAGLPQVEAGSAVLACLDTLPTPWQDRTWDGTTPAAADADPHSSVSVVDPATGALLRQVVVPGSGFPDQHGADVAALGLDGEGRLVASRWSLLTGAQVWGWTGEVLGPGERNQESGSDGRTMYYGSPDTLVALDVETGEPVPVPLDDPDATQEFDRLRLPDGGAAVVTFTPGAGGPEVEVRDADGTPRFTATGHALHRRVDDGTADRVLLVSSLDGGGDDGLRALDVRSGEELWRVADPQAWNPIVLAGMVLVRDFERVVAIDARTGATVWEREDPLPPEHSGELVTDGRLVVTLRRGEDGAELVARDVGTGDEVWSVASPLPGGSLVALPDGRVLLTGQDETVVLGP